MNQVDICDRAIAKIDKRIEALSVTRESWVQLRFQAQCVKDEQQSDLDMGSASVDDSGAVASASSRKSR